MAGHAAVRRVQPVERWAWRAGALRHQLAWRSSPRSRRAPAQSAQAICGEAGCGFGPDPQRSCFSTWLHGLRGAAQHVRLAGRALAGRGHIACPCTPGPSSAQPAPSPSIRAQPNSVCEQLRLAGLRWVAGRSYSIRQPGSRPCGVAVYVGGDERTDRLLVRFLGTARPRCSHHWQPGGSTSSTCSRATSCWSWQRRAWQTCPALLQAMPWWKPDWCRHPACQPTPGPRRWQLRGRGGQGVAPACRPTPGPRRQQKSMGQCCQL